MCCMVLNILAQYPLPQKKGGALDVQYLVRLHLDLSLAPYVLYGVKHIGLVSLHLVRPHRAFEPHFRVYGVALVIG